MKFIKTCANLLDMESVWDEDNLGGLRWAWEQEGSDLQSVAWVLTKSEGNISRAIFTCLLPAFSALTIFLRQSFRTDILTIVTSWVLFMKSNNVKWIK